MQRCDWEQKLNRGASGPTWAAMITEEGRYRLHPNGCQCRDCRRLMERVERRKRPKKQSQPDES